MSEISVREINPERALAVSAELSVAEVVGQVRKIQEVMEAVMKKDEHYGTIPGTDKPTLLKPGAEKLSLTFRLAPSYEVFERDLGGGHREYRITCTLTNIVQGAVWGQGVGLCSTMESKYRYRDAFEPTGKPVPKEFWQKRDQSLLGGSGFRAKKVDGSWQIVKITERKENPDLADIYNTVLKIGKKRAHVDAVLTTTAASDCFNQDLDEDDEDGNGHEPPKKGTETVNKKTGEITTATPGDPITKGQLTSLCIAMKENGWCDADGEPLPEAREYLGSMGYESRTQIEQSKFAEIKMYFNKKRGGKK